MEELLQGRHGLACAASARPGRATPRVPRLAFKPHLKAHVLSDTEVALIGETGQFALRGHAYAALAPLLDGSRSEDEIVAAVDGVVPPQIAHVALDELRARGHTSDPGEGGADPWSSWWHAHGEDPRACAAARKRARVAMTVLGLDGGIGGALRSRLDRHVRLVDDDATVEVCVVDDYLRPELAGRVAHASAAGRALLPMRPAGIRIWLGPWCRPDDPRDWTGFVARLRAGRPADAAALDRGRPLPLVPTVSTPETLTFGLSLAAAVVARCAAGRIPAAIDGAVWIFDTRTLESRRLDLPAAPPAPAIEPDAGGRTITLARTAPGRRGCSR